MQLDVLCTAKLLEPLLDAGPPLLACKQIKNIEDDGLSRAGFTALSWRLDGLLRNRMSSGWPLACLVMLDLVVWDATAGYATDVHHATTAIARHRVKVLVANVSSVGRLPYPSCL